MVNLYRATCSMDVMAIQADTQLLIDFVVPLQRSEVTQFFSKVDMTCFMSTPLHVFVAFCSGG